MSRKPAIWMSRRAFTLLELFLVLMLIGISAAAIVPNLNGSLGRWQLRETARNLQTALQLASQYARMRQETTLFVLDVRRQAFLLRTLRKMPPGERAGLPIGRQSLGQGVEIVGMEGFRDLDREKVLVFHADGTAQAATILVTGSRPDGNRQTVWQITLDDYGTVLCRERLADESHQ